MPRLDVTVKVNRKPLRRAYVERLSPGPGPGMYITNDDGRVQDEDEDLGIDSQSPKADIRIHCQNSVVRVLDGQQFNVAVSQDKSAVKDGDEVVLNTTAEQKAHYAILNRCLLVYDVVFRQFRPFSTRSKPDFPLGRRSTLQATKDRKKRIEVSYPSQFPLGTYAFNEPHSSSTNYPLMHLRPKNDPSLFGAVDGARPTLIPSEMAHALHFSLFSEADRQRIQDTYIGWIMTDIANGGPGTHDMGVRTSPQVAYIEALDHFSHRFAEYVREVEQGGRSTLLRPQTMTVQIRQDFFRKELSGSPVVGPAVATLDGSGQVVPNPSFNGGDDEGSVYGCIFVDFARRVGLLTAVNAYLRSATSGVFSFDSYKTWVANNIPQHLAQLDQAQQTWGL